MVITSSNGKVVSSRTYFLAITLKKCSVLPIERHVGDLGPGFPYFPLRFLERGEQTWSKADQHRTRRALSNGFRFAPFSCVNVALKCKFSPKSRIFEGICILRAYPSMEMKRNRVYSIELVEFYLSAWVTAFGSLDERIVLDLTKSLPFFALFLENIWHFSRIPEKKYLMHWIELAELYVSRPCSMFALLYERIAVENTRIQAQDLLG